MLSRDAESNLKGCDVDGSNIIRTTPNSITQQLLFDSSSVEREDSSYLLDRTARGTPTETQRT